MANGQTRTALHDLVLELQIAPTEEARIRVQPGLHWHNDNRLAEADSETLLITVDPQLVDEGASGACQDLVHELAHLRHFQRDRAALHEVLKTTMSPLHNAEGCAELSDQFKPARAEDPAFDCLEDDALTTHNAAYEIEAVLAQAAAAHAPLRFEDYDYLLTHVKLFDAARRLITTHSNESYYLPEIKKEDERIYRDGVEYIKRHGPGQTAQ